LAAPTFDRFAACRGAKDGFSHPSAESASIHSAPDLSHSNRANSEKAQTVDSIQFSTGRVVTSCFLGANILAGSAFDGRELRHPEPTINREQPISSNLVSHVRDCR
jgi:hypothetical protein